MLVEHQIVDGEDGRLVRFIEQVIVNRSGCPGTPWLEERASQPSTFLSTGTAAYVPISDALVPFDEARICAIRPAAWPRTLRVSRVLWRNRGSEACVVVICSGRALLSPSCGLAFLTV